MTKTSTHYDKRIWSVCLVIFVFFLGIAAQDAHAATSESQKDIISFWLEFLFRGETGSQTGLTASLSLALKQALHAYSMTMFTIGAFLLLAQLVFMVAETAHTGVVMGRRSNQMWAPLRLLLGIVLLVPLGSGLGLGQSLVVKIASSGSDLASECWQIVLDQVGVEAAEPLAPHTPDIGRAVASSIETELCRNMYRLAYKVSMTNEIVAAAGDMADFDRLSAGQLSGEVWRYSNAFFPREAICGAYRFLSPVANNVGDAVPAEIIASEAAHASAERLSFQAQSAVQGVAGYFMTNKTGRDPGVAVRESVTGYIAEQRSLIENKQSQILSQWTGRDTPALMQAVGAQGWAGAGAFPFSLSRSQTAFGELVQKGIPQISSPLLGSRTFTLGQWEQAARQSLFLPPTIGGHFELYDNIYFTVSDAMRRARLWLYSDQIRDAQSILPEQQAVADILGDNTDAAQAWDVYSRVAGIGATSFGLFARAANAAPEAASSNASTGTAALLGGAFLTRPFQTLAELGRRYAAYGNWLLGMVGPALSSSSMLGAGIGFSLVALAFSLAGLCLLFAVPFIPFFRFVVAVVAWGVAVIGAVLSLPLVALAHLYPSGDGLAGPLARRAYWLWLGLFLRPVLILFGFLGGLLLFVLGMLLVNALMLAWLAPMIDAHGASFMGLRAGISLVYAFAAVLLSFVAFKGIAVFPSLLTSWINLRSYMPESVVIAPHGLPMSAQSAHENAGALSAGGGGAGASGVPLTPFERLTQKIMGKAEAGSAAPDKVRENARQSVHFPNIPEQKAAQRAIAKAQAFAKVEAAELGGGKVEAAAGASSSSGSGESPETRAMAIARHMVPDVKDKDAAKLPELRKLEAEEGKDNHRYAKALKKSKTESGTASPEQEATSVSPENNPFKKPDGE